MSQESAVPDYGSEETSVGATSTTPEGYGETTLYLSSTTLYADVGDSSFCDTDPYPCVYTDSVGYEILWTPLTTKTFPDTTSTSWTTVYLDDVTVNPSTEPARMTSSPLSSAMSTTPTEQSSTTLYTSITSSSSSNSNSSSGLDGPDYPSSTNFYIPTPTTPPSSGSNGGDDGSSVSLRGGTVAGIVIGIVAFFAIGMYRIYRYRKRGRIFGKFGRTKPQNDPRIYQPVGMDSLGDGHQVESKGGMGSVREAGGGGGGDPQVVEVGGRMMPVEMDASDEPVYVGKKGGKA